MDLNATDQQGLPSMETGQKNIDLCRQILRFCLHRGCMRNNLTSISWKMIANKCNCYCPVVAWIRLNTIITKYSARKASLYIVTTDTYQSIYASICMGTDCLHCMRASVSLDGSCMKMKTCEIVYYSYIMHNFIPPPRRSSHVQSDYTYTVTHIHPLPHLRVACPLSSV